MKAVLFSFTRRGAALSLKLQSYLEAMHWQTTVYGGKKFIYLDPVIQEIQTSLRQVVKKAFLESSLIVFIGACGIAVRSIAPFVKSKTTDPAVIVIDEKGTFVIPLLSGHIGGANTMALKLASYLQAKPVLTTATDVNHLFAVDEWAACNNMIISSMGEAKAFSAGLVDGRTLGVYSDFPFDSELPSGMERAQSGPLGMAITLNRSCYPFDKTVVLRPKIIHLGIGCRRGTLESAISRLVVRELRRLHISSSVVADINTIDIKKDEKGLIQFAKAYGWPLRYYSADELNRVVDPAMASSPFVQSIVGTDNVCERAAFLGSHGGTFLLRKISSDGVTIAITQEDYHVNFNKME